MPAFGTTGTIPQPGATYKCTRIGLATFDEVVYGSVSDISSYSQGQTAPAPFAHCILMEIGITVQVGNGECDSVLLQLHYEGFDSSFTDNEIRIEGQLTASLTQEPIETHPDFLNFAGYRGEEDRPANLGRNGAVYEEATDGQFRFSYFLAQLPTEGAGIPKLNRFAGVSSWLYPQETYVQTRMDTDWPDENELELLGKILVSDWLDNNVPLLPQAVNWMYTGIEVTNIGNQYYPSRRTATASGPRGYIPQMYELNYGGDWEDQT
jgi:hypothetical protein